MRYILTATLEADHLPTFDICEETPRDFIHDMLNGVAAVSEVVSFTLYRETGAPSKEIIDACTEVDRWPPSFDGIN